MANDRTRLADRHEMLRHAVLDGRLSKADLTVLTVIEGHANHKEGFAAWPGLDRLVSMTGLSQRSVLRSIQNLASTGYVDVQKNGRSNVYFINMDNPGQVPVSSPIEPGQVPSQVRKGDKRRAEIGDEIGTPIKQPALKNPIKRTPAAPFPDDQEQEQQRLHAEEQKGLAVEEQKATQRQGVLAEYLQTREAQPKRAASMLTTFPYLAQMIEDKAA